MLTTMIFRGCADSVKEEVRRHWPTREARLSEQIGTGGEAPLDLTVQHEAAASRYAVRAVLPLRTATLTAEALAGDVREALDRAADQLEEALRRQRQGGPRDGNASDYVDAVSADSFPASDAPSWTPATVGH